MSISRNDPMFYRLLSREHVFFRQISRIYVFRKQAPFQFLSRVWFEKYKSSLRHRIYILYDF
jgi:hypothetical protein